MELHFINNAGLYIPANKDAKNAFKLAGLKDAAVTKLPENFVEACTEWGFKVYVRQENQAIHQAVCLNSKFKYLNCKS